VPHGGFPQCGPFSGKPGSHISNLPVKLQLLQLCAFRFGSRRPFERRARQKVGTTPAELRRLADWLVEHEVEEVVMESTAQYWRPEEGPS